MEPYDGPPGQSVPGISVVRIREFIAYPRRTKTELTPEDIASAMVGRSAQTTRPRELEWSYPFNLYFDSQFRTQLNVLKEARNYVAARLEIGATADQSKLESAGAAFHPKFAEVARNWLNSGEYDDAISNSIIAVNEALRKKTGSTAKDGQALMQNAFSPSKPMLLLSNDPQEQRAYMELFASAWAALRSPRAHSSVAITIDRNEALELVAFASALMRLVDKAVASKPPPG